MSSSEVMYREGYTQGYQNAIKDITAYKIPKNVAKKFSIEELKRWENFEDEFFENFCIPPKPQIPLKKNKTPTLQFLYIVKMKSEIDDPQGADDNSFYKIGIATDIKKRLSNLQTGTPIPLEVHFKFRTHYADLIEKQCHDIFSELRTSGEWFFVQNDVMNTFIKEHFPKLIEEVNNSHLNIDNPTDD